jgi:hypothetical protein
VKLILTAAFSVVMALSLATAGESTDPKTDAKPEVKKKDKPPAAGKTEKVDPKLKARIKELIKQLGHDEYDKREAAGKALVRIGKPAREQVAAARKDKDAERATRAGEVYEKLKTLPDPANVNRDCTNGWMAVWGEVKQVQTFTVKEDVTISKLRFRAARGFSMPGTLSVDLQLVGAKKDADALATASQVAAWTTKDGKARSITRYMRWWELELKAKLLKGKTYKLVFSSVDSTKSSPWLINCMYRDHFKAGSHLRQKGEKASKLGAYDLVMQLCAKDEVKLTTVPAKLDFTRKELFGLGHDGANMGKTKTETNPAGELLQRLL